jgi:4-hydroxy-3-methylbut-2-en-1-yl diphosphate reductase
LAAGRGPPHRVRDLAPLLILAPLRLEARAVRGRVAGSIVRSGVGRARAERAARRARSTEARGVAVIGFCGALDRSLVPGEIVVATALSGPERGAIACPEAPALSAALDRRGLTVRQGPIVSVERIARGRRRAELEATGAIAVDMESVWLADGAAGRPFVVVRAVVDTPERELLNPFFTVAGALRAYRALRGVGPALEEWSDGLDPRQEPRGGEGDTINFG